MPIAILVLALCLLMSGLGGFVLGLSLLPADSGRAWLVAGATLLSAGGLALVIGFGVQAIVRALQAQAQPLAPEAAPVADHPEEPLSLPPEPEAVGAPAPPAAEPPRKPSLRLPGFAAGGALLGGAAILAGRRSEAKEPSLEEAPEPGPLFHAAAEPVAPPPADEFERDLFSQMDSLRAEEPAVEPAPPVVAEAALPPLAPFPALDLRLAPAPEEPVHAPSQAAPEAETPAPVPGLIADEDLAALDMETPPLAPLETLEVVGAYDSGGVRFTMYSDGSVNAAGPQGERRYPSLEALRKQLDSGAPAV
jgi:hypothetical protein